MLWIFRWINKMGGTMHNSIIFYILLNGPLYIYIKKVLGGYKMYLGLFFFFFYLFILKDWTLSVLSVSFFCWHQLLYYDYHSKGHCGQSERNWIVLKGRHVVIVVCILLKYLGPFHIEFLYWEFLSYESFLTIWRGEVHMHMEGVIWVIYICDKSLVFVFV